MSLKIKSKFNVGLSICVCLKKGLIIAKVIVLLLVQQAVKQWSNSKILRIYQN